MATRRRSNKRADAVAAEWLTTRPTLTQMQEARNELGVHGLRAAVAAHDRARNGVFAEQSRGAWPTLSLPFDDDDEAVR